MTDKWRSSTEQLKLVWCWRGSPCLPQSILFVSVFMFETEHHSWNNLTLNSRSTWRKSLTMQSSFSSIFTSVGSPLVLHLLIFKTFSDTNTVLLLKLIWTICCKLPKFTTICVFCVSWPLTVSLHAFWTPSGCGLLSSVLNTDLSCDWLLYLAGVLAWLWSCQTACEGFTDLKRD